MRYVCGFAFSSYYYTSSGVVLIVKKRPEWQAGKINGIGGKIELGEDPIDAMVREFQEETGVLIPEDNWDLFCTLKNPPSSEKEYIVFFYRTFNIKGIYECKSTTDEEVIIVPTMHLPEKVHHNLRWLVPLAFDSFVELPTIVEST